MLRFFKSAVTIIFILFAAQQTLAANYKFDKTHTQIFFTVSHLGLSHSTGQFLKFDGGFSFDESDFSKSTVNISIKANSIELNNGLWNSEMKNNKWLDVENYPTIDFVSQSVVQTGGNTMDVAGNLTIRGVTRPVTLKAVYNGTGKSFGKEKIGFDATTSIDRKDFGMSLFTSSVGEEVVIRMTVEGFKQK